MIDIAASLIKVIKPLVMCLCQNLPPNTRHTQSGINANNWPIHWLTQSCLPWRSQLLVVYNFPVCFNCFLAFGNPVPCLDVLHDDKLKNTGLLTALKAITNMHKIPLDVLLLAKMFPFLLPEIIVKQSLLLGFGWLTKLQFLKWDSRISNVS